MTGNERYDLSSIGVSSGKSSHALPVPKDCHTVDQPRDFVESMTDIDDADLLALELADQIE